MDVAVCVCTCGRPALLDRLLGALRHAQVDIPQAGSVEVIIIDNFPDGRARAVCERHAAALPVALHFVEESRRGISFARNRAIEEALGRGAAFVAFIDDDDLPQPDWLARLIDKQRETGADIVTGVWRLPEDLRIPSHLSKLEVFAQRDFDQRSMQYDLPLCATCNVLIACRAIELITSAGGPVFRPEFALTGGGDTDFFIRVTRAGAKMAQAKESVVARHPRGARVTLAVAIRQAFRKGNTQMIIAAQHLSADRYAKLRRRSAERLVRSLPRLLHFSRAEQVAALYWITVSLGNLYADFGGRYRYYRRLSPDEPAPRGSPPHRS